MEREWTVASIEDGESLDESFENVSAPSSFLPPITLPPRPPKLPVNPAHLKAATSTSPAQAPQRPSSQQRGSAASSLASRGSSPSSITSPVLALTPSAAAAPRPLSPARAACPLRYPSRPLLPHHARARLSTHLRPVHSYDDLRLGPQLALLHHLAYLLLLPHVRLPLESQQSRRRGGETVDSPRAVRCALPRERCARTHRENRPRRRSPRSARTPAGAGCQSTSTSACTRRPRRRTRA
jgi:hypothetical protein